MKDSGATIGPNILTKKIISLFRDFNNVVSFFSDYIGENPATIIMVNLQYNGLRLEARLLTSYSIIKQPSSSHTRHFDRRSSQRGSNRRFNMPVVVADDLEATQDNLFDMLLDNQASVNAMIQGDNLSGICEERHQTLKYRLL